MKLINGYHRITNFLKIRWFDLLYGKAFVHGRFSFRDRMNILIEKGGKLSVGDGCFFNNDCSITCMNSIQIGSNTLFGEDVKIYDHNYHINSGELIKNSGHTLGSVVIGNNCWIGSNAVILKGTVIGDNCVIGAGCVIDGTIPPGVIVKTAGNTEMISRRTVK